MRLFGLKGVGFLGLFGFGMVWVFLGSVFFELGLLGVAHSRFLRLWALLGLGALRVFRSVFCRVRAC